MIDPIHAFYLSKEYIELSRLLKLQSGGRCGACSGIFPYSELRTHHVIELTVENIHDPRITLNPDNIEVICHKCHNKAHNRFNEGKQPKRVFVVWGAPCAGKTSYVAQVATRYDLIIDLDRVHRAICNCGLYDKPDSTKREAFAVRDLLLDRVRVRAGKWCDAYIIGGYPERTEREEIARDYMAELIHIDTSRDECIRRAAADETRAAVRDALNKWIDEYFRRLTI